MQLSPQLLGRRVKELSGGQTQRLAIARALAVQPQLLILDEPASALDAASRGTIIELLRKLQRRLAVTTLLISHEPESVRALAKRVYVFSDGKIVESGSAQEVFANPQHEITKQLLG